MLTDRFGELSAASQAIHAASMGSVAIAIVLLIAPASYHRVAAGGNAEESVLRYTVMMMLPAEGLVALGLVGEAYVTVSMVSGNVTLAIVLSSLAAVGLAVLLYGVPLTVRWRRVALKSLLRRYHHFVTAFGEASSIGLAACLDVGELGAFIVQAARNSLIAVVVTDELHADVRYPLIRYGRAHHHADPVAMASPAVTGVERETAKAVED